MIKSRNALPGSYEYPHHRVLHPLQDHADNLGTGAKPKIQEEFESFLNEYEVEVSQCKDWCVVEIDYMEFIEYEWGHDAITELIRTNPSLVLSVATRAVEDYLDADCVVRFSNLDDTTDTVESLSHTQVGHLVVVDAIVDSRAEVSTRILTAMAECQDCGYRMTVRQSWSSSEVQDVSACPECDAHKMEVYSDPEDVKQGRRPLTADSQRMTLVDVPENLQGDNETSIVADIVGTDLVNEVNPGDRVKVAGIVRVDETDTIDRDLWLQIVGMETKESDYSSVEITQEDEREILELADEDDVIEKLTESIAPSVANRTTLKRAILFSLLGGVHRENNGDTFRDDINLMLVGDPGTAKSTLAQTAARIAPKSRYTSGRSASGVGITASVERVEHLAHKEWAVKRGAISAASGGVAVLDELDKMHQDDRAALNEPLSEQQISVEKATVSATLPADTTVIAAANPKHSRFDPYEPKGEQLQFDDSLMSRFDLIFAIEDTPGEDDDIIASHVLASASEESPVADGSGYVDEDMLRKYIAYARRHYEPTLSKEAESMIERTWKELRGESENDRVAVTPRRLQSIIRLSQASAKARLSDTVEVEDAERAIDLVLTMLEQVATDSNGNIDADIVNAGGSAEARQRRDDIVSAIQTLEAETEEYGVAEPLLMTEVSYDESDVRKELEELEREDRVEVLDEQDDALRVATVN